MTTPALPPCAQPGISGGGVTVAKIALPCGLSFPFPKFKFPPTITLPFQFPPVLPFPPKIGFQLSCDLKNPINVTTTLPKGAARVPCFDVDGDAAKAA